MDKKQGLQADAEAGAPVRIAFAPMLKPGSKKIARLPVDLHDELDRRLTGSAFHSSRELSKWLAANGYTISHTSIHKYGQKFERRLDAIRIASEQARLVCEQFDGDDVSMQNALMRLVQTQMFDMLTAANETAKRTPKGRVADVIPINLTGVARTVAGLLKVDVERRRWAERTREKIAEAAETLEAAKKSDGLSDNVVATIRGVLMAIEE